MRTLKFKAWDAVRRKMFNLQAVSFDMQNSSPFAVSLPGRSWEPVSKFELIQWTGLTDLNGTDVYEGDLVRISSLVFSVVWNESQASFELTELGTDLKHNIHEAVTGSVIGNRFENA